MNDNIEELQHLASEILNSSERHEKFNRRKDVFIEVLTTLNLLDDEKQNAERLLDIIQNYIGVEAIAIRLKSQGDFPYYVFKGFPDTFIELERSIFCEDDEVFNQRKENGCLCWYVIYGKEKPEYSVFTPSGSFYTTSASKVLADMDLPPIDLEYKGACFKFGYETIAIIPLICKMDKVVGLLQLCDKRQNAFSPEEVEFLEGLSIHIGTALARIRILKDFRKQCGCGYDRPDKDNELQSDSSSTRGDDIILGVCGWEECPGCG